VVLRRPCAPNAPGRSAGFSFMRYIIQGAIWRFWLNLRQLERFSTTRSREISATRFPPRPSFPPILRLRLPFGDGRLRTLSRKRKAYTRLVRRNYALPRCNECRRWLACHVFDSYTTNLRHSVALPPFPVFDMTNLDAQRGEALRYYFRCCKNRFEFAHLRGSMAKMPFHEDAWERPGGGGGRTRLL